MPQSLTHQFRQANAPSPWLQYLGPIILSILAGWFSVIYFAGSFTQRVTANTEAIAEQKEANKSFATKDESRIFHDSISRELTAIHEDVRAIRSNVEKK